MLVRAPESAPPRPAPPALPIPATALIGRDAAVADAREHLLRQDVRFLTLTGTAGVGKTRLGLAVAAAALDYMADGAVFVDLAPIADPALVLARVAEAVGVKPAPDQPLITRLSHTLHNQQRLLLIDNCEHVLSAGPELAALLAACPALKVLATSRAPLRLSGEQEVPISPLAEEHAVRLFIDTACRVRPDIVLDHASCEAIRHICRRLDGLPLAIELAAARCRVMDPNDLLARFKRNLPLLTGGSRDSPARHRTLSAAIGWSYDLLLENERLLFRRLSVFVDQFSLEAAEAICAHDGLEVLPALEGLVEWSLVGREAGGFRLLETLREFALEQLAQSGDADGMWERHALRSAEIAEQAAAEHAAASAPFAGEADNARVALAWTVSAGRVELGLRLASALRRFWFRGGQLGEGRQWLEKLLAMPGPVSEPRRTKALCAAGVLAVWQDDRNAARGFLEEGLAAARRAGNKNGAADALGGLELLATRAHDNAVSLAFAEEAVAIRRELGEPVAIAEALSSLGRVVANAGDAARSRVLYEESLMTARQVGDRFGVATVLSYMARDASRQGELAAGKALSQESLVIFRELGVPLQIAWALLLFGTSARGEGDLDAAESAYREALGLTADMALPLWVAVALAGLGGVAVDHGQAECGARLLGAAEGVRARVGVYPQIWDTAAYERDVVAVRSVLGDRAASALEAGKALALQDAVWLGLEASLATARSPRDTGPLTTRERQVAALVAHGLSNRQIAARLVISARTAGNHVEHILNKLGLHSRSQIAVWAVNAGLEDTTKSSS